MVGTRDGRSFGAALLLATAGCARVDSHEGEETSEPTTTTTSAESTSGPSTSAADTTGPAAPGSSSSDGSSGSSDDACAGDPRCPDPGDLPQCEQLDAPICGDAVVQAFEECDGGPGCRACQDASEPAPLVVVEGERVDAMVPLADGGVMILEDADGP